MKRRFFSLLAVALAAHLALGAEATNEQVSARKSALDLAGAFANDGYKLRDGHWDGSVEPGKPRLVQVNLYAGNEYWFSVGTTGGAKKMGVAVFDETGKPVDFEPFTEGTRAAAGFSPSASGPYYVRVEELEGTAATFCLLYSYK